jgi:hypothetical protein
MNQGYTANNDVDANQDPAPEALLRTRMNASHALFAVSCSPLLPEAG